MRGRSSAQMTRRKRSVPFRGQAMRASGFRTTGLQGRRLRKALIELRCQAKRWFGEVLARPAGFGAW